MWPTQCSAGVPSGPHPRGGWVPRELLLAASGSPACFSLLFAMRVAHVPVSRSYVFQTTGKSVSFLFCCCCWNEKGAPDSYGSGRRVPACGSDLPPKAKCLQRRSARRPGPGRTRRRRLTVTTPSSPRCLPRDARAPRADTAERRQDSDARARALIRAIEIYGRPPWTWMGRHGGRRDVAVALGRAREQLRPACAHPPTATGPPLVHFWFWPPPRGAAQVSRVRGGRRRIIGHGLHPAVQGAPGLAVASRLLVEGAAVACTQYKL